MPSACKYGEAGCFGVPDYTERSAQFNRDDAGRTCCGLAEGYGPLTMEFILRPYPLENLVVRGVLGDAFEIPL